MNIICKSFSLPETFAQHMSICHVRVKLYESPSLLLHSSAISLRMAYILHHSTTFHNHGSGYHKIEEGGASPVGHSHFPGVLGGHSNTSVQAAFIHVVGDLLQSVGVMVAATIIYFRVSMHMPMKDSK